MKLTVAVCFALVLLSACTENNHLPIGFVAHLTGPGAFWGTGEYNAATMAVQEINARGGIHGKKVSLIVEDGKTDFTATATVLTKLIDVDRVAAIIGPTWFGQIAGPIAEQKKTVILSPSAGVSIQNPIYFFDLWPTEQQATRAIINHMIQKKYLRIALVYSQNEWSLLMKQAFVQQATEQGIIITEEFETAPDETDFRTVIARIQTTGPEAVYGIFAFYPSQGQFSRQAKQLGFIIPIISTEGTENPELLHAFPEIENTAYVYPARTAEENTFRKRYAALFQTEAPPSAAYAYDSMNILAAALETSSNTEELTRTMHANNNIQGVTGNITFDAKNRVLQKTYIMKHVVNNSFTELTP